MLKSISEHSSTFCDQISVVFAFISNLLCPIALLVISFSALTSLLGTVLQRWSRGRKARGQGHKKNPRPRTAFPRTDTLEAKNRNARGQGPRTQNASALQKKKVFTEIFQAISKKKRSSQKFFKRSPQKNVFQKIFQALHKILTNQKIVLSSSRGQANF